MIIISTSYTNFDAYLNLLSKPAKKNYLYVKKHNQDLSYSLAPFHKEEIETFMRVWEQQLVFGKPVQWAFPYSYVEALAKTGKLLCFRAQKAGVTMAIHFIQKRVGFWECHPPLYEKNEENEKRYLAKYMWFSLINYFIEHKLGFLDMGGGVDAWRETIHRRAEFPNLNYKWVYVPEKAKQHPEREKPYIIKSYGSEKILDFDNKALMNPKQINLLFEALLMRLRRRWLNMHIGNSNNLDPYQGEPIQWSEHRARSIFLSKGIHDDGWTEKRVTIQWKNSDVETIRISLEFPHWGGKSNTFLYGKINGKRFVRKRIKTGQTELHIGPLRKGENNTITLVSGNKFNMPAPDKRCCYLRIIEFAIGSK
jgi:hypothetical protein